MYFKFVPITLEYAEEIKKWKYKGFIKSIYMEPYFKSYNDKTIEMRGPDGCKGFAVLSDILSAFIIINYKRRN